MKIQVSQDILRDFIRDHDLKLVRLAELTGLSEASINVCFRHRKGTNGLPRTFTSQNIQKINEALPQIADALQGCILKFGGDTFDNNRGKTYDRALVKPMKKLGEWFKLTALVKRILGWNQDKKEATLVSPSSKRYGCITKEDADRLNAELLSVAAVLSSYEVVEQNPDKDAINPDKQDDKPIKTKAVNKGTPAPVRNEWDDTSVDLLERYAAFHRLFPNGLIAFAVNDGFTVCEDDARLLARIDTMLQPYTDPATGHVTLYMDGTKWRQILRFWDDGDEPVAETPMYAE